MWGYPQAPLNKFGISITAEENSFFQYCYTLLDPNVPIYQNKRTKAQ